MVYFGDAADLSETGKAKSIITASMVDKYTYDESRVGFYYNSDPECHKQHQLQSD